MLSALFRAFAQLSDPDVRRVVWIGIGAAALGSLALSTGVTAALALAGPTGILWLDRLLDAAGGLTALLVSWLLFPALAGAISSFLLDDVIAAVERRHYPWLPPPRNPPLAEEVRMALRFFVVLAGLNLLALPLHFLPGVGLLAAPAINGYLLGREYFELVACRRLDFTAGRRLRRARGGSLFAAGLVIWLLAAVPLLNLAAPVLAAAFMVHVFHRLNGTAG